MIQGIGTDIVEIKRIKKLIAKYNTKFLAKVLSPQEIKLIPKVNPHSFVAGRFAVKESLVKALGGREFSFPDISIINDEKGRPFIESESIANLIPETSDAGIHVSISHERDYAVAFVIIDK